MPQPIGRRDSRDDSWRWGPEEQPASNDGGGGQRPARSGLILAGAGAVMAAAGIVILALAGIGDDDSSGVGAPTRTAVAGASKAPGATGGASTTPPGPSAEATLYVWSRQRQRWLSSDLALEDPGYREGEAIPFLLRIEEATPGSGHEVEIGYECQTAAGAAFDYLAAISESDFNALLREPGPQRHEDASIPIPDDPDIAFDGGSRFRAWGSSFQETPQGPLPAAPCQARKQMSVNLMAQDDALFLMWGAHVASAKEWGEGRGAASQRSSISVEVSVDGEDAERLRVGPDAIAPESGSRD